MIFDLYAQKRRVRLGSPASVAGGQTSRIATIPAPVGWNARDAISAMKKGDALQLENWMTVPGGIATRFGQQPWANGLGGPIETLMEWAPASGLARLFAATPTAIFDVSAAGAVGSSVQTGLANGRWQHVNFATAGGGFLIAVNGQDAPRQFDGTTWTSPVITAASGAGTLNANNLVSVMAHVNRLWFIEKSTRKVWYLDARAISGTANLFDLSSLTPLGGELVAMNSWTRDGGDGSDDYAVFLTSKGEALVYGGTNPSDASTFGLVGRFRIAEPVGRRCTYKLGAELIVLTSQGPLPLSEAMGLSVASQTNRSVSDKIAGAFRDAYAAAGGSFGWQIVEWPKTNVLLVNVPRRERGRQDQFVFGTTTGGWSSFTGFDAGCWSLFGTDLFYGGNDGVVRKAGATSDAGRPIIATYRHSFQNLGSVASKIFTLARPRMSAPPGYLPAVHIRTDYNESAIDFRTLAALDDGPVWDQAVWDVDSWGFDRVATQAWQSVEGFGSTVSVAFRVAASSPVMLNGVDLAYEEGGYL